MLGDVSGLVALEMTWINIKDRRNNMCSTPKMPSLPAPVTQETIAAPTTADASVSKASSAQRNKVASLAGRDIKTSARGLSDKAQTNKKQLLGE